MSGGYQIRDQGATYFLTFQIVDWVDIFTRNNHKLVAIDCLNFCRTEKGLLLYAFVIMTNHIHLIARARNENISDIIRDFKKFTANKLLEAINLPTESRRDWILKRFEFAARKHTRNSNFQVWTHENHPIELYSGEVIRQKLNYLHQNPVRAGWVEKPEDYLYSSARNYAGVPPVLEIDFL